MADFLKSTELDELEASQPSSSFGKISLPNMSELIRGTTEAEQAAIPTPVAPPPPAGIVPASMNGEFSQPQAFTTPQGYPAQAPMPPPAASNPFGASVNKIERGLQLQSEADQMVANATVDALGQQEQGLRDRQAQRETELVARKQLQEQKKVDLDEAQKAYTTAQAEAGTGYWENKSTGSKIAAAIAQGLGAYGAALTGTQNFAAQTIENAVKQDAELKIRKAQLAKDRTGAVAQRYDSLMADIKDESAVRDVIFADGLAVTKNKIDMMAARAKSQEAKARALQASGELGIKIEQYMGEAAAKAAAAQGKNMETYVPGLKGNATTKEGAAKLNELVGSTNTAKNGINKLLQLTKTSGGSFSPEQRQEAETTASLVRAALRVPILGPGTVNDAERAIMERIVANPNTILSLDNVSKRALTTLVERLDANVQEQGAAYGIGESGARPQTRVVNGTIFRINPKTGRYEADK